MLNDAHSTIMRPRGVACRRTRLGIQTVRLAFGTCASAKASFSASSAAAESFKMQMRHVLSPCCNGSACLALLAVSHMVRRSNSPARLAGPRQATPADPGVRREQVESRGPLASPSSSCLASTQATRPKRCSASFDSEVSISAREMKNGRRLAPARSC